MAPQHPSRLGAFVLDRPLARGGMGEVWTAHHHRAGWPAAAKVLTADGLQDEALVRALRAEIRAAAALTHPSVVRVYDAGEITGEVAARTGLREGAPWFVMELAEGGTLLSAPPTTWAGVRRVLLELLDALAHAHARGVVHRDLKPDNVLFTDRGELRLADFGLVLLAGTAVHPAAGTPQYMAPEQFMGAWEAQGPWTDLYAVGCLGWWMVTGKPPFRAPGLRQLMRAHLDTLPPELEPVLPVPQGLDGWLRRLLAKDPTHRYRRAADAAAVLARLPEPQGEVTVPFTPDDTHEQPTLVTLVPALDEVDTTGLRPGSDGETTLAPRPRLGVPQKWPRRALPASPGAPGLGLVGLSEPPLVGRIDERTRLWSALVEVATQLKPRGVVLEGPPGVGKSRLARWLCESSHELGVATVLTARHDPGRPEGLVPMIKRALGLQSHLTPDALVRALGDQGHPDPEVLAELIAPGDSPRLLPTAEARADAIRDAVLGLSDDRIPVVWIDDAHWSSDAVAVTRRVLDGQVPTLVILTTHPQAASLAPIVEHERTTRIDVGPLPPDEQAMLIRSWIQVDPDDARQIASCAAGNPLFTVQLVDDVVARGALEGHTGGWALSGGVPLPSTLDELCRVRVDAVLRLGPESWRTALELAALLGPRVDGPTWARACDDARVTGSADGLLVGLLDLRLAAPDPGTRGERWSFAHGVLRDVVIDGIADGELQARHLACAHALISSGPPEAERRAAHFEAAGNHPEHVRSLITARRYRSGFDLVGALALARGAVAAAASLDDSDPLVVEAWLATARAATALERHDEFEEAVERALGLADRHRHKALAAEAQRELAVMVYRRGRGGEAAPQLEQAIRILRAHASPAGQLTAWLDLARIRTATAEPGEAVDAAVRAFTLAEQEVAEALPEAAAVLAGALLRASRLDDAEVVLEGTLETLDPARDRRVLAELHAVHGRIARERGDLEVATQHLRTAASLERLSGSPAVRTEVALVDVLLARGEPAEADATLRATERHASGRPEVTARRVHLCLVANNRGGATAGTTALEQDELRTDPELAVALERAAGLAAHTPLAVRLLRLALTVWTSAADVTALERVRTKLAEATLAGL